MSAEPFVAGAIVRGGLNRPPKLTRWSSTFEGYLSGEAKSEEEAYLTMNTFPADFKAHFLEKRLRDWSGPVFGNYVCLDFDNGTDPAAAIKDAQRLLSWMESNASADLSYLVACFSGAKGAHVYLPLSTFEVTQTYRPKPSAHFPKVCKAFVAYLTEAAGVTADMSIYTAVRLFRLPNTRHPKTGLLKLPFVADEFVKIEPGHVMELAKGDRRDALPPPVPSGTSWADWNIQDFWNKAEASATEQVSAAPDRKTKRYLNRATLEFIQEGAPKGTRAVRLFQAAANLGEFGADERFARALLEERAQIIGLAPYEIDKAIQDGVRHGKAAV